MNLLSLRYFIEIGKTLSFTQAAKNLHISQPGLSQQIHQLETQLEMKLLHRTTRKVELTEEGYYLFGKLAPAFAQIETTVGHLTSSQTLPTVIRIASIPSAASLYLPQLIEKMHSKRPEIKFHIKETTSVNAIELVKNKEYHIGLIRTPVHFDPGQEEIELIEFRRYPLRAVVSSAHPLADHTQIQLDELKEEVFLHYNSEQSPALFHLLNQACQTAGFSPHVICTGSELLTISNLVASNVGVTLMPTDMIQLIESPKIHSLPIQDLQLESSISAVWERNPFPRLHTNYMVALLHQLQQEEQNQKMVG